MPLEVDVRAYASKGEDRERGNGKCLHFNELRRFDLSTLSPPLVRSLSGIYPASDIIIAHQYYDIDA